MNPDSTGTDADAALAGDTRADADALPLGAVFEALSNTRSRRLLYRLADEPGEPIPVDDLALAVAAREAGDPSATPAAADVHRVLASFHHQHLPRLADLSLISRDEAAGTATLAVAPESLEPYLSLSRRADEP